MDGEHTGWSAALQATMCATLVDEWIGRGLAAVMVAPGSRSTPVALEVARRPELAVHVFHDERSAAFAALGWARATRRPAAVLCTSGTAATHLLAAVVEAGLSGIPLLVMTADRPPELHGVGAPQTIDQVRLYGRAVRWFADIAPATPADVPSWRVVAAEAWNRATGHRPGPVHLNVGLREPLLGESGPLPPPVDWAAVAAPPVDLAPVMDLIDAQRGVIVAGEGVDDPAAVHRWSAASNWPVLADPQSGCRGIDGAVAAFDALLRHRQFAADHTPQVVVQLGMAPASKALGEWVAAAPGCRHVAVSPYGLVSDPRLVGATQVHAPIGVFAERAAGQVRGAAGTPWRARWLHAERTAQRIFDDRLGGSISEPAVARLLSTLPPGRHLVVSSSMPVRDLEWFGAPGEGPVVHANRGANGIDGVLATAIGVALTGARTTVLIGDIALCHDASSLTALSARDLDLDIVVIDNDGGGIFSFLPQAGALDAPRFERLFGTPHGTDLVALAAAHGVPARTVTSPEELRAEVTGGRDGARGARLIRVASNRAANVTDHRALNDAVGAALDRSA